jgi:hypothetical protein
MALALAAAALSSSGCSAASPAGGASEGTGATAQSPEVRTVKELDPSVPAAPIAACDIATAGTMRFASEGRGENGKCESCVSTSCALPQCFCLADPSRVSEGDSTVPACSVYASCLYSTFMADFTASPRHAFRDLRQAEATCKAAEAYTESSVATGNLLLGCMTVVCSDTCGGPM